MGGREVHGSWVMDYELQVTCQGSGVTVQASSNMVQGSRLNGPNTPYTEEELQAAKEAMEAVMERDAGAVDEVVGSLRAELHAMDAEYNELLMSIQEAQQQQQQQAGLAAGAAQRGRGGYGEGRSSGGGGGIGGDLYGQTVGGGGGGGWDDGVVVTGDRGIDGGDVSDGGGRGGDGLDSAQLAEAAQRAAWLMERMEAKGAQILQLTTLAGHAATQ